MSDKGTGTKFDGGKLRMDLVPVRAFKEFVAVLTFGAAKYGAGNWRKVIGWRWRYMGAAFRHMWDYMLGEKTDPESGRHHLAHALCCLFFVLDNELTLRDEPKTIVPDGDTEEVPPEPRSSMKREPVPNLELNAGETRCACGTSKCSLPPQWAGRWVCGAKGCHSPSDEIVEAPKLTANMKQKLDTVGAVRALPMCEVEGCKYEVESPQLKRCRGHEGGFIIAVPTKEK